MNTPPNDQTAVTPAVSYVDRWLTIVGVILALTAMGLIGYEKLSAQRTSQEDSLLFAAKRGALTISIAESGTITNRDLVMLKSEVEGRTTILSLIPEGTQVEVGRVLVELDASPLEEALAQQKITVLNAQAADVGAQTNHEVTLSQGESDVAEAELAYRFAQLDLQKYLEGEYPKQLQQAQSSITIATEELQRASDRLEWSTQLAAEGYITQTELLADELALKRATINLELAETELQLLRQFTNPRQQAQLESDVEQTRMALDRTINRASANDVQAAAELTARESELERQQVKLDKLHEQITRCTITAPVAGMVVYATTGSGNWRGNAEPLAEGQEVREQQELIHLPTTSSMMAEVKVHESSLRKVHLGQLVRITIDALPGRTLYGRVGKIGILPDAVSAWLNPDLTVYNTEIYIEGDASLLRPGMTCRAEIIVEEYVDVLYVPVQSVVRVAGRTVVYVQGRDGVEMREVATGLDNNRMICILDSLAEGEQVLLAPPLAPSTAPDDHEGPAPPDAEQAEAQPASQAQEQTDQADQTQTAMPDLSKIQDMTPEERRRLFESLTPAQQAEFRRRSGGRGGGGQGGPPHGGQ